MSLIVFCSRISAVEQQRYLALFRAKLTDHTVLPSTQVSQAQREQVTVAIVANPDPSDLLQYPNLEWVHSLWAGVERLVNELDAPTFALSRLIDPNLAKAMTEACIAWTLYLHRDMPAYQQQQLRKQWQALEYLSAAQRRVTVLGLGELGVNSAQALAALGFEVSGWSRSAKTLTGIRCYSGPQGLADVLPKSDIVISLLPLTAETKQLLNTEFFRQMPQHSQLINFGRGGVINTSDLLAYLDSGWIRHAVLDVFDQEPLPTDNPLWSHARVTVLPHISAPTNSETATDIVSANILRYLESGELPATVDFARGY